MGYKEGYLIGKLFGVLCGVLAGILLLRFMKKDGRIKCRYDERQELIRGRGFKYAFYALLACLVADILFWEVLEQFMERSVAGMLYLCIGVIIMSVYGIWNDGYFSLNENPRRSAVIFFLLFLVNFAESLLSIHNGLLVENGRLTDRALNLLCASVLFVIVLVILIKNACRRRQEEG